MGVAKVEVLNGAGLRSIRELRNRMLGSASLLLPLRSSQGKGYPGPPVLGEGCATALMLPVRSGQSLLPWPSEGYGYHRC